ARAADPVTDADHDRGGVRVVERGARVVGRRLHDNGEPADRTGRADQGPGSNVSPPNGSARRGAALGGLSPRWRSAVSGVLAPLGRLLAPRKAPGPASPGRTPVTWKHALCAG